jgi:tRNA(adenine34) deaminase
MTRWPLPVPMQRALELAAEAAAAGEVPVGAVVVQAGRIIGEGRNAPRALHDPTAHAEIAAIRQAAARLGTERLGGCALWVTLEPCPMCAGAIVHARLDRVYYSAPDPKGGAVAHGARLFDQPGCLHRPEVYCGMGEGESAALLRGFFKERR